MRGVSQLAAAGSALSQGCSSRAETPSVLGIGHSADSSLCQCSEEQKEGGPQHMTVTEEVRWKKLFQF